MPSGVGWERVLRLHVGDVARMGSPYVVFILRISIRAASNRFRNLRESSVLNCGMQGRPFAIAVALRSWLRTVVVN